MAAANINQLLEKTTHFDKDERYMATNDLCQELSTDLVLESSVEANICAAIIKQLDDASNDVQSIAVKCLSILVKKVREPQVVDICDKLCTAILSGKDALRDIYSIGLKTCISGIPDEMGAAVATRVTPRLLNGASNDDEAANAIKLECLDLLTDLLSRFGSSMSNDHGKMSQVVLKQLNNSKPVVRKRATACVGQLATAVSDNILNRIMETLLNQIETPSAGQNERTLIQAVGTVSRTVGFRLGSQIPRVVPLFLKNLKSPDDEAMHNEAGDELRENIMHALESFVLRCPREITDHLPAVLAATLSFVQFDPNYNYESDDEDSYEDEDMDDYEEDEADYSDDDDTSWKVRRASVKVISSVIVSRPEMLQMLYGNAADVLLQRFKEREESVKLDVIACFTALVRVTVAAAASTTTKKASPSAMDTEESAWSKIQAPLVSRVAQIVKMGVRLLNDKKAKSVKTKVFVFTLLTQVVAAVEGGGLQAHVADIMPLTTLALTDRNATLKLETLVFVRTLFERTTPAAMLQSQLDAVVPPVVALVKDDWYKVSAEALRCVYAVLHVMRPRSDGADMFDESTYDVAVHSELMYNSVLERLSAHDIDQEIKEGAIQAMGGVLATLGDKLTSHLSQVLPIFVERLRNEITRVFTLRALASIAESPLKLDLTPVLADVVNELSSFMRQQSRTLKQETLFTSNAVVVAYGASIGEELSRQLVVEAANLVSDSDLHLSNHSLVLVVSVMNACPEVVSVVQERVLPLALSLAYSPLLHGTALESLLAFLTKIGSPSTRGAVLPFNTLLNMLVKPLDSPQQDVSKTAIQSISKCIATLCLSSNDQALVAETVRGFIKDVKNTNTSDIKRQIALLSIGEIGVRVDISQFGAIDVLLGVFDAADTKEDTKSAAARALGTAAVGNLAVLLPTVLNKLTTSNNAHQYLLLLSLREILMRTVKSEEAVTQVPVEQILNVLMQHCENAEEGVRNMVAECLGNLAIVSPQDVVPKLAESIATGVSPLRRWTLVTAYKFAAAGDAPEAKAVLHKHTKPFFETLKDADLTVRRAALLALNSAAHHQPELVRDMLEGTLLPILYAETTVKEELKRKVNLGPFKHLIDDGLPLRKSAFSCLGTIIEISPEVVNVGEFIQYLRSGLSDNEDVQMLCHQILVQLCAYAPHQVVASVGVLLEPLNATVSKTIKSNLVGTEVERAYDVIRSALRALDSIAAIPEASSNKEVQDLLLVIQKKEHLKRLMDVEHSHLRLSRSMSERI